MRPGSSMEWRHKRTRPYSSPLSDIMDDLARWESCGIPSTSQRVTTPNSPTPHRA